MNPTRRHYDPARDEEESAILEEQRQQLRAAMQHLSEFDRTIVTLRYVDNLSNRETAQSLGLTDQAASMRYLRAMRRLRKLMKPTTE